MARKEGHHVGMLKTSVGDARRQCAKYRLDSARP